MRRLPRFFTLFLLFLGLRSEGQPAKEPTKQETLQEMRRGYATRLLRKENDKEQPPAPPIKLFKLVKYPSPAGLLNAYVSPRPADGQKRPLVIWVAGGFSNGIGDISWTDCPSENDQSASSFRKAGILMMYPALRGGSANPGFKEGLYGEVDDVIAAAEYAAKLDYVNTNRIYLGGHSTGGTLVLLAAEYTNRFRAVFSFGPAGSVADYGLKELPFDVRNRKEAALRAPRAFLSDIRTQTFVMEGTEGNREDLEDMRRISKNPAIKFILVPKIDHFGILQPASKVIAEKILSDSSSKSRFELNADQILGAFQR